VHSSVSWSLRDYVLRPLFPLVLRAPPSSPFSAFWTNLRPWPSPPLAAWTNSPRPRLPRRRQAVTLRDAECQGEGHQRSRSYRRRARGPGFSLGSASRQRSTSALPRLRTIVPITIGRRPKGYSGLVQHLAEYIRNRFRPFSYRILFSFLLLIGFSFRSISKLLRPDLRHGVACLSFYFCTRACNFCLHTRLYIIL
jgi:hypothetical protein